MLYPFLLILALTLTSCASMKKNNTLDKTKKLESIPKITKPTFKKIWVPDEIRNNGTEYVEGHYIYIIEKDTTWSK
jgi:uncharacterized lipoprotein YmbA